MIYPEITLNQYEGKSRLLNIIRTFEQAVSIDDFTDDFITEVWDVSTCGSYGLDVWGKIVDISRYVNGDSDDEVFGFNEANASNADVYPMPFSTAPFYGGTVSTNNVRLGDAAYRTLILAKAFSNISIATIPEINRFLTMLFSGRGRAYCTIIGAMKLGITVEFELETYESNILQNYSVMPIPNGTSVTITQDV